MRACSKNRRRGVRKFLGLLGRPIARKREFFGGCTSTSVVGRRRSCRVPSNSLLYLLYLPQHRQAEQFRPKGPFSTLSLADSVKSVERIALALATHSALIGLCH